MSVSPLLTFIMPAHNAQETIRESLDALIALDDPCWLCIIVNDGSTDDTLTIADGYRIRDSRFSVISQRNGGVAAANWAGVQACTTSHYTIYPADDFVKSCYLSVFRRQRERHPEADVFVFAGALRYPDGKVVEVDGSRFIENDTLVELIRGSFFSLGAAVKVDVCKDLGGWNSRFYTEDYDFWVRACLHGCSFVFSNESLTVAQVSDSQKSADLLRMFQSDLAIMVELYAQKDLSSEAYLAIEERTRILRRHILGQKLKRVLEMFLGRRFGIAVWDIVRRITK